MEDFKKQPSNNVIDFKQIARSAEMGQGNRLIPFKIDEELIQSAGRIKNQRDLILERISKMKAASGRVSKSVFEKVYRDYNLQLETINELFNEKKNQLLKEIKELYRIRERVSVEINRHREILEEAEFRHYLNEFSESQYHEVEQFETQEIQKLEADLTEIYQIIRSHEALFDPEDLGLSQSPQQRAPQPKITEPAFASSYSKTRIPDAGASSPEQTKELPQNIESSISTREINPNTPATRENIPIKDAEFDAIFTSDDESSQALDIQQSQSNINNLLGTTGSSANLSPQEDYFKQSHVDESSLQIQEDTPPLRSPSTEKPETDELDALLTTDQELSDEVPSSFSQKEPTDLVGQTTAKNPKSHGSEEDSISEILESIHLDGEENQMQQAAPRTSTSVTPGDYRLIVLEGDLDAKEYKLSENTSIGRSPSNDLSLKAPKVSRQHAAINKYNNQYIIIDLKSSNGVFVNGAKIDEYVLQEGDEISIGGYRFKFTAC